MKTCPKCGSEYETTNTLCPMDGTVLQKVGDDLIGQTLSGKYRVDEHISDGGMGAVYRATHILMDKTVAIKVLHPALAADDKVVARFTREAKAASRISHPHALNVTDFGEAENGVVFLVMEYLGGRTLKDVIRSDDPLPLPRIVEISRQVCGALDAAHAEGVIHRDLKSDNIMLEEVGTGDWAKVLDFGIAKIQEPIDQDPALTAPNLVIGTPQYMSPEQCSQSAQIDARSDVYSLGVILYEMLTGHVPFTGESPTAVMMQHLQELPPSVLEERPDLSPAIGDVVARALAKLPEDRFQSAGEMAEALSLAVAQSVTSEMPAVAATTEITKATSDSEERVSVAATNHVSVPTAANALAAETAINENDEATIVHQSPVTVVAEEQFVRRAVPPPVDRSKSWRIAIPAVVLLVIVLGAYALTRDSRQPASGQATAPLTSDPNSQPVQPVAPPTGESERNVMSPPLTQSANTTGATNTETTSRNTNRNVDSLPPPIDNLNLNVNVNTNTQQNGNVEVTGEAEPTPSPANRNTNQRRNQQPSPQETTPTPATTDSNTNKPPPPPASKEKQQQRTNPELPAPPASTPELLLP